MVIKTREKLIEVARQLFTYKGIENTTMNDIASASDKGRRTIYTYFKNKREIYNAIVEQESERMVAQLRGINTLNVTPTEKLEKFLTLRFEMLNNSFARQEGFKTFFNRDIKRVERIRRIVFSKEIEILKSILDEGVAKLEFIPMQAQRLTSLIQMILQGLDFSYLRDNATETNNIELTANSNIVKFIIEGIKL